MRSTVSPKRLAANRANAAKSTGPRSLEGRTRAAQNARKHGLAAGALTVPRFEEAGLFENLRSDAVDFYRPVNGQEQFAVERIAMCQLALVRAERIQSGFLAACAVAGRDPALPDGDTDAQDENLRIAMGFEKAVIAGPSWTLLMRYQAQAERQYQRAVAEFDRLAATRDPEFPNEPNSDVYAYDLEWDSRCRNEPICPAPATLTPFPPDAPNPNREAVHPTPAPFFPDPPSPNREAVHPTPTPFFPDPPNPNREAVHPTPTPFFPDPPSPTREAAPATPAPATRAFTLTPEQALHGPEVR